MLPSAVDGRDAGLVPQGRRSSREFERADAPHLASPRRLRTTTCADLRLGVRDRCMYTSCVMRVEPFIVRQGTRNVVSGGCRSGQPASSSQGQGGGQSAWPGLLSGTPAASGTGG